MDQSPYLRGVPRLSAEANRILGRDRDGRPPTRQQRRKLEREIDRMKKLIRVRRTAFEKIFGAVEIEPPTQPTRDP